MLLGICPLLVTLFGLVLPRISPAWLCIVPFALFLCAFVLLLANCGVATRSSVLLDEELASASGDENAIKRQVAGTYFHAAFLNAYRTDYAVDVYRASGRYIFIGTVAISALLMWSIV